MKRLTISLTIASLAILAAAAAVSAAGPRVQGGDRVQSQTTLTTILGLTQEQIADLRQDGLTLSQIAERQDVDPERLVEALVAQWTVRIDARVANGALTTDQATELKERLALRARAMVEQVTLGGMRGAAVGAGPDAAPGAGAGNGNGAGNSDSAASGNSAGRGEGGPGDGVCDGTGRRGAAS